MMTKAGFTLDPLGNQQFEGYADGRRWNGWVCPAFTHAQATRLVDAWRQHGGQADYDAATDTFRFGDLEPGERVDLAAPELTEHYIGVTMEGQTLYPIGAGAWTWDEVAAVEAQSV